MVDGLQERSLQPSAPCLEYVADIMNITAIQSLNWQTPLQRLTGQTPDSGIAMVFQFYDEIYFCCNQKAHFPSQNAELNGHDVGHSLTYKILLTGDMNKALH
jgi:hypothetical protein